MLDWTTPEDAYNEILDRYNDDFDQYQNNLHQADIGEQRFNYNDMGWQALERARQGSGYGGNRFYSNGEIYNYDPIIGNYTGSASGRVINNPGASYQVPDIGPEPIFEDYVQDDPWYQGLIDPNSPTYNAETVGALPAPEPALAAAPSVPRILSHEEIFDGR